MIYSFTPNSNNYSFNNKNSFLVQNTNMVFTGKNQFILSREIKTALKSNDNKAREEYFEQFANMPKVIFRNYTDNDIIKSIQLLIDTVTKNSNKDRKLIDKYIEIIHSGICPATGVGEKVNTNKLEKIITTNNNLSNYSKEILQDIFKETNKKGIK